MVPMSLVAAVAPRRSNFIKNGLCANSKEETKNLLQNGMLHFVFRFSEQSESSWKVRI